MRRFIPMRAVYGGIVACFVVATVGSFHSHGDTSREKATATIDAGFEPRVREVRVLVASGIDALRLRCGGPCVLPDGRQVPTFSQSWLEVSVGQDGTIRLGDREVTTPTLEVRSTGERPVEVSVSSSDESGSARMYPGAVEIKARENGGLEVINHVAIEPYVACVVANEVWPTFADEALRAQAVASRTYALYQMTRRSSSSFDVSATQGSQVYRGIRNDEIGRRANEAAQTTSGLVCTFSEGGQRQLFCAYYSAACGGVSQSASIFGDQGSVPPLAGGVRCEFCRIAPPGHFRWGPVRLKKRDVLVRLAERFPRAAELGDIRDIEVSERSSTGRATTIRLSGATGERLEVSAERFRLALGGSEIRSTSFSLRDAGDEVVFENGRGFGHGLGLCQWGTQGQAIEGKKALDILRYYYPGCDVVRAY